MKFLIVLMLWFVALLVAILFGLGYEGLGMLAICWGGASIPMTTVQLAKRVPNISALRLYFLLVYSVSIPFIVVPPFYIHTTHDNLSSNALTVTALLLIHVASMTFVLPSHRTHEETHP